MVVPKNDTSAIFNILTGVKDPEIPVVNIVEMGIVRDVIFEDENLNIYVTPTYSACPAVKEIKSVIERTLLGLGYSNIKVQTVLSPAWTTDWLSESTKQKLRSFGIAPPTDTADDDSFPLTLTVKAVKCPLCGSKNTIKKSDFGSTLCKSLYHCKDCLQPFEVFKCI